MEDPILTVSGLSKKYALGTKLKLSLKEELVSSVQSLFNPKVSKGESFIYALNDISFSLNKGDVLGIIGENGAGKSTLLKILSGITPPTGGKIIYKGRFASILDIGTGFHPDLSGRENIGLNASLAGLSSDMIINKFDQIVAFSGVGKFIDTPVKHYSNGMYLRLAFSLAFFIDVDILVLDEVLSVGDLDFRIKSYDKIRAIANSGSTVIVVSHDVSSIEDLCNKCLLLEKGKVKAFGRTNEIVEKYVISFYDHITDSYKMGETKAVVPLQQEVVNENIKEEIENDLAHESGLDSRTNEIPAETENDIIKFLGIEIKTASTDQHCVNFQMADSVEIVIKYILKENRDRMDLVLNISDLNGVVLSDCPIYRKNYQSEKALAGSYAVNVKIPGNLFNAGTFFLSLIFGDGEKAVLELPYINKFKINLNDWEKDKKWNEGKLNFPFRPQLNWEINRK